VFRNAGNKEFYVFDNYDKALNSNNEIDVADASFRAANVNANYFKGNVIATTISSGALSLSTALPVASGGTGQSSFTTGQIVIGSGTNGLTQISNVTYQTGQTFGSASSVATFETDVYGRVVAVSNTGIAIDASAITSGTLGVVRGGTGAATFSSGGLLIGNGTDAIGTLANSNYVLTGTLSTAKTITSLTVDAYGRVTAATGADISIDTSQISSGTLGVVRGGTGASSFTAKGITYGNGTDALLVTAAAGTSDQTWSNQVLTTTDAGVPVWTTALDGGQF
jgi:hypothetical protein